jgi:hypothetical protein
MATAAVSKKLSWLAESCLKRKPTDAQKRVSTEEPAVAAAREKHNPSVKSPRGCDSENQLLP